MPPSTQVYVDVLKNIDHSFYAAGLKDVYRIMHYYYFQLHRLRNETPQATQLMLFTNSYYFLKNP